MKANYLYEAMLDIDDVFIEEADHYRKNRRIAKVTRNVAAAISLISILGISTVGVNAATNGLIIRTLSDWFGVELITDENKDLIGTEINDTLQPETYHGTNLNEANTYENIVEVSRVINSVSSDDILLPTSVSEFEVKESCIPEIIMTNGSMAVFYQNDYEGWECRAGDILTFSFEKYESEITEEQTLVVGYIKDGILYEGAPFKVIEGKYEMLIEEPGIYNFYVVSATSDYLALKQGKISVNQ